MTQDTNSPRHRRETLSFWIAVLSMVLTAAGVLFPIIFSPKHEITITTSYKEKLLLLKVENSGDFTIDGTMVEDNNPLQLIHENLKTTINIPKIFNPKDYFEIEIPKITNKSNKPTIKGKIKNVSQQNIKIASSEDIFIGNNLWKLIYKILLYIILLIVFLLSLILGYLIAVPYHESNQVLRRECFQHILKEMRDRTDYIQPFNLFYTLYNWDSSASIHGFRSWILKNKKYFFENLHLVDNEYYFYLNLWNPDPRANNAYILALKEANFLDKFSSSNEEFKEILRQTEEFELALVSAYKKNKRKFKWCGATWNGVVTKSKSA